MRISVDAFPRDLLPSIVWLGSYIGSALDERFATLEQHAKRNPLLSAHNEELFALEHALVRARQYRRNTGRAPKREDFDDLYSFAIPAQRIFERLPEAGQTAFIGKLRDFVSGRYGARPFAYEIAIASHLMRKGWDVELADLCGTARFDFLARLNGVEVEVECKTTSGDAGRKIHRKEVNRLSDLLLPTTTRLAEKPGCHLLSVIVPDRLLPNERTMNDLASLADRAASTGQASSEGGETTYRFDSAPNWPEPRSDPEGARDFFERRLGVPNAHLLFHSVPGRSIVVVNISSKKPDKVVAAFSDEAKDAAKQCSGTRPALIAMHIIDPIGDAELADMLRTSNGLHKIAHAVFKNQDRAHVDSIAFTVPRGMVQLSSSSRRMTGRAMMLFNDRRKFETDAVRSIFQHD